MKIQNTTTIEWYGQCPEMWESWPEPVFYKLFLDPDGRNASLSATKVGLIIYLNDNKYIYVVFLMSTKWLIRSFFRGGTPRR